VKKVAYFRGNAYLCNVKKKRLATDTVLTNKKKDYGTFLIYILRSRYPVWALAYICSS
jgi:hypothetical protein